MNSKEYIESGILEQYVLGTASVAEQNEVEERAAADPAIRQELDAISEAFETLAMQNAIAPDPIIRPFLIATINYTERLQNGEPVTEPPLLNENSTPAEYETWLSRADMASPGTEDVFAKIIGHTEKALTAIVWLKEMAPQEVHDDEHERFLIIEGTCDIVVGNNIHQLVPGDYFAIPLHSKHHIKVTSTFPCKVILQRVAA
ncbi:MAG: cupin domain-containing protein [Chitinophagaceae bacterium]